MEPEIIFSRAGGIGRVLLNRPKALNALTLEMSHALEGQLRDWAGDHSRPGRGCARRGGAGLFGRRRYPQAL